MMSEKQAQKFHTDDLSLPGSEVMLLIGLEANFTSSTTNQKQYPDLGSDASSVWNFCALFSDAILQENQ